jgi:hypothetical protein
MNYPRSHVSRDEALAAYLGIGGGRSLVQLHQHLTRLAPIRTVSVRSLKEWSRRLGWRKKAVAFDAETARRLLAQAQEEVVKRQFDRVVELTKLAQSCLDAANDVDIDPATLSASDIRTLASAAIDAIKMVEVLTGGVSDRAANDAGLAEEAVALLRQLETQKREGARGAALTPPSVA